MTAKAEVVRFVKVIDYGEESCRPANEKTGGPLWTHDNGMVSGMSRSGNISRNSAPSPPFRPTGNPLIHLHARETHAMGQQSRIEWTDHTFNPWWGCTKISPGCDHCYAAAWDRRTGGAHWGPHAPRRVMSDAYWRQPRRWNATPYAEGRPWRVFCASMADGFDNQAPPGQRERLWALIRTTPNLEWLLLTKRPQNIPAQLPADWGTGYPHVRLGVTVENSTEAERRIPRLTTIPMRLAPFLSCEPLLSALDLTPYLSGIGWVIGGGESGPRARPMRPEWVRSLRDGKDELKIDEFFSDSPKTPRW